MVRPDYRNDYPPVYRVTTTRGKSAFSVVTLPCHFDYRNNEIPSHNVLGSHVGRQSKTAIFRPFLYFFYQSTKEIRERLRIEKNAAESLPRARGWFGSRAFVRRMEAFNARKAVA